MTTSSIGITNINVGVLGHVDSGKTSLVKILSSVGSTAAFDKHPQSRERGITLDLGFSSFLANDIQFTLVDCPGHASLIRTVIGGAQIIDLAMLVIDAQRGIQTQTAECLVLAELVAATRPLSLLVALNKVDLLSGDQTQIDKMSRRIEKALEQTRFRGARIVPVSAHPGGGALVCPPPPPTIRIATQMRRSPLASLLDSRLQDEAPASPPVGLDALVGALSELGAACAQRARVGAAAEGVRGGGGEPFVMAVDHCFAIRGQGTVLTGTVLSGAIKLNQAIEIPALREERKVKSLQVFHKPVDRAAAGDRVGLCVTQFDASLLERGLICSPPGSLHVFQAALVDVHKVRFYKQSIESRAKFHITLGHETCMGTVLLFGRPLPLPVDQQSPTSASTSTPSPSAETAMAARGGFEFDCDYEYLPQFVDEPQASDAAASQTKKENREGERDAGDEQKQTQKAAPQQRYVQFALVQMERALVAPSSALLIGSRLDSDLHANACRLAFYGRLLEPITSASASAHSSSASSTKSGTGKQQATAAPTPAASAPAGQAGDAVVDAFLASGRLRVFKRKCKTGRVERIVDQYNAICVGLFKKHSKFDAFNGFRVTLSFSEPRAPSEQPSTTSTTGGSDATASDIDASRVERKLNGVIEGAFGQSGKFKVRLTGRECFPVALVERFSSRSRKQRADAEEDESADAVTENIVIRLEFKRFLFDSHKRMIQ